MKHILSLLTIALAFTATSAYAAFTYEIVPKQYTNANYEGTDGKYFTIRVSEGSGKIYITNFFNTIQSGSQSEELTAAMYGITDYGYAYVTGGDGGLHTFDVTDASRISEFDSYKYNLWKANQNLEPDVYVRKGYELGTFNAGDEIEIYMSNGTRSVKSNTPVQGQHISNFGQRTDALNASMPVAQLYLGGPQINFGIVGVAVESSGGGEGGGPVGSPLPGGLQIALVAGVFALGFWYVRRRKAIVG